jgi:hypothetical protein
LKSRKSHDTTEEVGVLDIMNEYLDTIDEAISKLEA